jgi:hypothetical protein
MQVAILHDDHDTVRILRSFRRAGMTSRRSTRPRARVAGAAALVLTRQHTAAATRCRATGAPADPAKRRQ